MDLSKCAEWSTLADSSQNCVVVRGLIHAFTILEIAPELVQRVDEHGFQELDWYLKVFRPYILRESGRILKPDGHLLLNSLLYRRSPTGWTIGDLPTEILLNRNELSGMSPEDLPLIS